MHMPIGRNPAQNGQGPALLAEMVLTAQAYGARHEMAPTVAKECAKLVAQKFPQLAIPEIREAYRQWAAGQIQADGADMYGGSFNAAQLGKVLAAYCKKRDRIAAAIRRAQQAHDEDQRQAAITEAQRQQFAKLFPLKFEQLRSTATTWADVPVYFFDVLWKRQLIQVTVQYSKTTRQRAIVLAQEAIKEDNIADRARGIKWSLEDRTMSIAKRIAVFELCLQNPDYQLPENITEILLDGDSRRG